MWYDLRYLRVKSCCWYLSKFRRNKLYKMMYMLPAIFGQFIWCRVFIVSVKINISLLFALISDLVCSLFSIFVSDISFLLKYGIRFISHMNIICTFCNKFEFYLNEIRDISIYIIGYRHCSEKFRKFKYK